MLKIAILCGGSGTRLWPLSRASLPKQFVKIFAGESLFARTVARHRPFFGEADFIFVASDALFFLLQDELKTTALDPKRTYFILEQEPRNTAAALILVALLAKSDDVILALPSDAMISDLPGKKSYENTLREMISAAQNGKISTIGIPPTTPHTGFGYINTRTFAFTEKPDPKTAEIFLKSGDFLWNAGIFCFRADVLLAQAKIHAPEILHAAKNAFHAAVHRENSLILPKDAMLQIPNESIDTAVMEKSDEIFCVRAEFSWNDMGSFDALAAELGAHEPDAAINSANNFVISERFVATVGVQDTILIDSGDAILLAKKGETQHVKNLLPQILKTNENLAIFHTRSYRPWGHYEVLLESPGYKIKKICVDPEGRLSLQKHLHRSEHWVVVSGVARVTNGENITILRANESIFIPIGAVHRLENIGKIPLEIIEVQLGEYLGEDDIIRLDDAYHRQ